ncbi:MAG: hypothetical protein IJ428_00910 [Clostridia bacterium]|nr:hypothetical protein [Clostridia bacterium]
MNPNTPFYIDHHPSELLLDGEWHFTYVDESCDEPWTLDYSHTATLPASTYRCLERAGILPDPYFGTNSKLYEWVDKKIWYFSRSFTMSDTDGKDVFLCFDGVGYFCRVWLNGQLLCAHEGMFGGPVMEVGSYVINGENELCVEVTSPSPGHGCYPKDLPKDSNRPSEIVPWNICRDNESSTGDFIVFGIWRSVRLEIVPKTHISRPYIFTKSIDKNSARLHLSVEIADPQINELDNVLNNSSELNFTHNNAYSMGLAAVPTGRELRVRTVIVEKNDGKLAYSSEKTVQILDKKYIYADSKYHECQFFEIDIEIENPLIWWPNQMGEANVYAVTLELYEGDTLLDMLTFNTGIRTIEYIPSSGLRHRTRWEDFHFVINGRPIFLKGMNWQPLDFLYDISTADYRWALELVKNEGIELLRVWSGGGMPEDDRFYDICDELGIMVMQDSFIANQTTEKWDREVLQSQVCQNLYRIRNHPSLALHTGGNEFNSYAINNDAAMWVISREIADLDPSRKFWRTSPDKGSAHIYRDMEPTWYRKIYDQLPFIAESGIHSFPNYKSLRQQISPEEYNKPLSNIFSEEFTQLNPELRNHFSEFIPARIPRMMSRASVMNNIRGITLSDLCEATQMASCDFYQIMIQSMRENYPINCGILPWCFKRPWTTTAIQLVDGLGEPIAPYYYVKNAYAPLSVHLALREITYAPGETIIPDIRLICDDTRGWRGLTVGCEIYSPTLECIRREAFACDITSEEYQKAFTGAPFTLPEDYTEKYFFLRVYAENRAGLLHQSVYWCKVLERMADDVFREQYRAAPQNNIDFDKGPWLKPQICSLSKNECALTLLEKTVCMDGAERRVHVKVKVENCGANPIFPIKLEAVEDKTLSYATDNYFFLPVGNSRELEFEIRVKDKELRVVTLEFSAWNAKKQTIKIDL